VAFAANIAFPEPGVVSGKGPCNTFGAEQTAPYPWFELGPIRATRRACADLNSENRFFKLLGKMILVEASGPVVILSNEAGESLVFEAAN
jgi:heat shock protein HslJ